MIKNTLVIYLLTLEQTYIALSIDIQYYKPVLLEKMVNILSSGP